MPAIIPTKLSAKIPAGHFGGQVTGVHVRPQEITENGQRKMTHWLEVHISRLRDLTAGRFFADEMQEIKASYPLPATPASAAGEMLARFGRVPNWGQDFDAEAVLLGKWVIFATDFPRDEAGNPTKDFVDVVRPSLAPDPTPPQVPTGNGVPVAAPLWSGQGALDRVGQYR